MMHLRPLPFMCQKPPSVIDEVLERYRRELDRMALRAGMAALRQILDSHTFFDRLV